MDRTSSPVLLSTVEEILASGDSAEVESKSDVVESSDDRKVEKLVIRYSDWRKKIFRKEEDDESDEEMPLLDKMETLESEKRIEEIVYQCLCCGMRMRRKSVYKHLKNAHGWTRTDVEILKPIMKLNNKSKDCKLCIFCNEKSNSWIDLGRHLKAEHGVGVPSSAAVVRPTLPLPKRVKRVQPGVPKPLYHSYPDGPIPSIPVENALLPLLYYPVNLD